MRGAFLFLLLPTLASAADVPRPAITKADEPVAKDYSAEKAAEFLDGINLAWTRERKCFACHTNVFYMHARPRLKAGTTDTQDELRKFLETQIAGWESGNDKPKADYNVLAAAMALVGNDAATTGKLHPATRQALDRAIRLQKDDGHWNWPKCDWPPLEHDDYYGVVFMAVAIGTAPEEYAKTEKAKAALEKIRTYLKKNPVPDLHHKGMILWASTKLDGFMTKKEQEETVKELLSKQNADGGWSLASLGTYVRRDNSPNDPKLSDGYGTGYVIYLLRQAGVKADDPALQKGVKWLHSHQRESGRWFTRSLKVDRTNQNAHLITNAGCAFVVLALDACGALQK